MRHLCEQDLALFAGGDLGFFRSRLLERHVRNCAECQARVEQFQDLRETISIEAAGDNLPDLNWNLIAAEMRANIRLGLEAGECVRPPVAARIGHARLAVAFATLILLVAASFFLRNVRMNQPAGAQPVAIQSPMLQSTPAGVELRAGSNSLTLLSPRGAAAQQTVSAEGEIRARYLDSETGSVTINNVYLQ